MRSGNSMIFGVAVLAAAAVYLGTRMPVTPRRSPMDQLASDHREQWLKRWKAAPRGANGLPLVDMPEIWQQPGAPLIRPPLSARVDGNRLVITRYQNGDACLYQAAPEKRIVLKTPRSDLARYRVAYHDDKSAQRIVLPARIDGAYSLPLTILPGQFFTGRTALRRSVQIFFFDGDGKLVTGCQLGTEDSVAIADFRGASK